MAKFKVGDKVFCKEYGNGTIKKIVTTVMPEIPYYVVFEIGKELYLSEDRLSLVNVREFIVIHRDGNVMTAEHRVNREVIKSAKATCAPSDTFDFDTGAKLAFDRLMGREADEAMPRCKMPKPAPQPPRRFKVGDRVVINETGKIGEVSAISTEIPFGCNILVAHENGFHSGDGFNVSIAKKEHDGKCEWFYPKNLSPAPAPEPPKYYTGKVVCISGEYGVGRIFTVKDGFFADRQYNCPEKPYKSVDDMNDRFLFGKFAEAKE